MPLDHSEFFTSVEQFRVEAAAAFHDAASLEGLEAARARYLGKNQGFLKNLSAQLGQLQKEHRAAGGAKFNEARLLLESLYDERTQALRPACGTTPDLDPTMPARRSWRGSVHPVSLVIDEICEIFRELGFSVVLGPEAESEWYNFTSLNFPPEHPAMELHDTLYLDGGGLLRTHTSPVQMRTLQAWPPPIRVLVPGNVYRRDFFDSTHSPMFAQIEGLAVDEGISFADLKATLSHFARRFFGGSRRTRFGPSYFPFTEPSAQMDVETDLGDGKGLRWVEIMGCGLVHPAVLESAGVDSERYSGWAFGMGPARIAQARHGISDCRVLFDSDVRVLEQFAR